MANEGITTRLQKEMGHLQKEIAQLQIDFSQMDGKLETRLKEIREEFKCEINSELQYLFERYFGQSSGGSFWVNTRQRERHSRHTITMVPS